MICMKILSFNEIFDKNFPIIGVVHLPPLPGAPLYAGNFDDIINRALRDAKVLEENGVDGIIVENYGDKPFRIRVKEPETIAAMAIIVHEIIKEASIPVGVNLLRNSAIEALSIAYVCKAKFIRVNAYVELIISDSGILHPIAPELLRYASKLNAKIGIFADIKVKHGASLYFADVVDVAKDALERDLASAVIITGRKTGEAPSEKTLIKLKESKISPVLIGSGFNPKTLHLARYADGAIVGTFFKIEGITDNPVDPKRVKLLVNLVKEKVRKSC
mgnify:FL=1